MDDSVKTASRVRPDTLAASVTILLVVNVVLNLVLLPTWGLLGAVVATTLATGCALAALHCLNHRFGMQLERGTLLLTFAPLALAGGPWMATAGSLLIVAVSILSKMLFTSQEKALFVATAYQQLRKLTSIGTKGTTQPAPAE